MVADQNSLGAIPPAPKVNASERTKRTSWCHGRITKVQVQFNDSVAFALADILHID